MTIFGGLQQKEDDCMLLLEMKIPGCGYKQKQLKKNKTQRYGAAWF